MHTPSATVRELAPEGAVSFPIQLNERWRVDDDPVQWILWQVRGKSAHNVTKYRDKRFHRVLAHLVRDIRELCGAVDPAAMALVEKLPEWHPDWDRDGRAGS